MSSPSPLEDYPLRRGSRLALSFSTLGLVGFSLVLLAWQLLLPRDPRSRFLTENFLGVPLRKELMLWLALGIALPVLLSGIVRAVRGPRCDRGLHRLTTLIAPLGIAFWLPALFSWETAQKNIVFYLIELMLFVFTARPLLTRSLEEWRQFRERKPDRLEPRRRIPGWLCLVTVLAAASLYTVYTAYFTIMVHRQIGTMAFDLGIYDNLMFNAMKGRFFHSPVLFGPGDRNYIAGHAELAMVLFVPFYAIRPSAETMLIMQSVMFGFAAVPLYFFGARLIPKFQAMLVALSYLLFAPLHGPHFYDFHWLPFAMFFHFCLYLAISARRKVWTTLLVMVLFAIREDVAVGTAFLGAFLFLTGIRMQLGVVLMVTSSLWFLFDKFWLMPYMGAWWFENMYSELFADGRASYSSVISTLISNPVYAVSSFIRQVKLQYGLHMVAPLAFLPLRRPVFLLLLITGGLFSLMTTGYWPTTEITFQYTTHWIPYLFLATLLGLWLFRYEAAGTSKRAAALIVLCIAVVSHSYNFGALLQRDSFHGGFNKITFGMSAEATQRYNDLMSLVRRIPQTASVAATEAVNPHISSRLDAYTFRYDFGPVDYMLVSSREIGGGDGRKYFSEQLERVSYALVARAGEFLLFRRGDSTSATDSALRELGFGSLSRRRHR